MIRQCRSLTIATLALVASMGVCSCEKDTDYVRVVVRTNDPTLSFSVLDLRVIVSGGDKTSLFNYQAQPKIAGGAAAASDSLSDFTVSFGESAATEVDVRIVTRPSGKAFDWGGDAHVVLPGDGRPIPLSLTAGEQDLHAANPLDGDTQSITGYGAGVAVAWPTPGAGTRVSFVSINPERVQGLERPPEIGATAKKVRIAARPSSSFGSDLYVTSWIEEGSRPMLRTEVRNRNIKENEQPEKVIDNLPGTQNLYIACDPSKTARLPIVSAAFSENRIVLHGHDETGATLTERIESPALSPINSIAGLMVTPDETVTLAVAASRPRIVQVSMKNESAGQIIRDQELAGDYPVAMSPNADGSRILVATVRNAGDPKNGALLLQSFSSKNPSPSGEAIKVAPYPFTIGDATGHVSLSSCAIAFPQRRSDGTKATDVWFTELDVDQKPAGEPHVANVSQEGHHWAPTILCLSTSRVFLTMFNAPETTSNVATLSMRRLPTK